MSEEWRDIPGYEGLYQASNQGRIRSLNYRRTGKIHLLAPGKSGNNGDYERVRFSKNGETVNYQVHRLIWEAFNGLIPEGMVINHMDENPRNNRLDNLMLCTQSQNVRWGTAQKRRVCNHSGIHKSRTVVQMNESKEIVNIYNSLREASRETGISYETLRSYCNGVYKTHRVRTDKKYFWEFKEL